MAMPYVTENNLTDVALERWKDIPDPRLRQIMQSLIKHLHGFVRDIEPTQAEWAVAIDWLTRTGKLCSEKAPGIHPHLDVLGVSMLVDAINHRRPSGADASTVEGPFHIPNAPSITNGVIWPRARPASLLRHRHRARARREPVGGAMLDLWQTDGEGLYEDQREVNGPWMRGLYRSQPDGSYAIRTVARSPIPFPWTDRGRADGAHQYQPHAARAHPLRHHRARLRHCVTHLFQQGDEFIETDVVYGVKAP